MDHQTIVPWSIHDILVIDICRLAPQAKPYMSRHRNNYTKQYSHALVYYYLRTGVNVYVGIVHPVRCLNIVEEILRHSLHVFVNSSP